MKQKLFSKMKNSKQEKVTIQTESSNMASSAMAEFDKLPVAQKAPESSPVNDFLDKVEE